MFSLLSWPGENLGKVCENSPADENSPLRFGFSLTCSRFFQTFASIFTRLWRHGSGENVLFLNYSVTIIVHLCYLYMYLYFKPHPKSVTFSLILTFFCRTLSRGAYRGFLVTRDWEFLLTVKGNFSKLFFVIRATWIKRDTWKKTNKQSLFVTVYVGLRISRD